MKLCTICHEPILKDQELSVVALGVPCTHDGGDYSFLDGFSKNETITHLACLESSIPNFKDILLGKKPSEVSKSNIVNEYNAGILSTTPNHASQTKVLYETLISLEEEVTVGDCKTLVKANPASDISDLLRLWFENRNKVS